jgi:cyclopropane-fatty-acyl-phospholipid synthase
MLGLGLAETGRIPDALIRAGIRNQLRRRLSELPLGDCEATEEANRAFREELCQSPVALVPELANRQHYEVAPAFFERVLGYRLKYSCGLWSRGVRDIDAAEEAMLALTCGRAQLSNGMRVLDLGCGWGSLSLWIAERYPHCEVTAVSNSKLQREFILARCAERKIENVEVVTRDINQLEFDQRFDRVISVEMFEHVRNYDLLLARIARWLEPNGKLFVHHFAHREFAYPYQTEGEHNWMGRHFFTGGVMPSDDMLLHFQQDLVVDRKWRVNGTHYQQTLEAWLELHDLQREPLIPILADVYGEEAAALWFQRWRLFFLACSELFGYRNGNEWWVTHVRMSPRESTR